MNRTEERETVQVVQVPETGMTHYRKPGGVSLCGRAVAEATPIGVVSEPSCGVCREAFAVADDTEQVSPEADTDARVDKLRDYLHMATKDEMEVLEDVAARVLGVGRRNYADALSVQNDGRDFRAEARDELLDALFYQSAEIKRLEGLLEQATRAEKTPRCGVCGCTCEPTTAILPAIIGGRKTPACSICRAKAQLEAQIEELRGGDGVYYVPQSYVGASAVEWDAIIPIDGNRRLVKRTVGSPTGPANEAPVTDDEADARTAMAIVALRDEVSALRHNQETDRARIRAMERAVGSIVEVSADDG